VELFFLKFQQRGQSIVVPSRRIESLLPRLDLWVAATMERSAPRARLLERAGITVEDTRAVVADAESLGIRAHLVEGAQRVVEFFGPPRVARSDRLIYDLELWPAHRFMWAVSKWGDVCAVGMRLGGPCVVPPALARDLDAARAAFQVGHHTEHEVRCGLGQPDWDLSWRQSGSWAYKIGEQRRCLRFRFDWGLLREITVERLPEEREAVAARLGVLTPR
jgi:hypothetical protein